MGTNRVNQSREQWAQIKLEDKEMEVVTKLAEHAEHRPLPVFLKQVGSSIAVKLTCHRV